VGSPAQTPSALQWEALKKLVLVQCVAKGKGTNLPKYVHPTLSRLLKTSPYGAFAKAYPRQMAQLKELAEKEKDAFATVRT
jgi:COP9 signalosome complex subunit 3